jgi:hypothetical protein
MAENMKMVMAAIQVFPPNHSFAHVPVWNNGPIVLVVPLENLEPGKGAFGEDYRIGNWKICWEPVLVQS